MLTFDRANGLPLERLILRPDLGAFERSLRERVERLQAVQDERLVRPLSIVRQSDGSLAIVSPFVPGPRLADLLEGAAGARAAGGVDAGLGLLLVVLPALCGLHAAAGVAHGTITSSRIVITGTGHLVLLDPAPGAAVVNLRYTSAALYARFGIAARPTLNPPPLGTETDVAQVALAAVSVLLGRPLDGAYPYGFGDILDEIVEVAEIRGSGTFATRLHRFLSRALPFADTLPFPTADDALIEVRDIAQELGLDVCRRALTGFVEKMVASADQSPAEDVDLAAWGGPPGAPALDGIPPAEPMAVPTHALRRAESGSGALAHDPYEATGANGGDGTSGAAAPLPGPEPSYGAPSEEPPAESRGFLEVRETCAPAPAGSIKLRLVEKTRPGDPAESPDDVGVTRSSGWLIPPERAAAFEPPAVEHPEAPPPPSRQALTPAISYSVPLDVPAPPDSAADSPASPDIVPPGAGAVATAALWTLPDPAPPGSNDLARVSGLPASPPLKLKDPPRQGRSPRTPAAPDIYASLPPPPRSVPPGARPRVRLVAAALLLAGLAAAAGVELLTPGDRPLSGDSPPAAAVSRSGPAARAEDATRPSGGRLEVTTEPSGAKILLDGKPVGVSPLVLDDVPPGRRTVTVLSSSGSVRRTVRVQPGESTALDVPIFSGWLAISVPFVVEVSESGRVIGSTEEARLMLTAGRHDLVLTNDALGYRSTQRVDVEPGEVRAITLDPRGLLNVNALPWAEVWIDGQKAGDTPLANLHVPLGIREVTFRHPQLGERRVMVTVRADTPATATVDLRAP